MTPARVLSRSDASMPCGRLTDYVSFRVDAGAQAQSLLDFDRAPISLGLYPLVRDHHRRVILTGMGAAHAAALPSWRRLVAGGKAAWWIGTDDLVQNPHLVTSDSLLIATSRSGADTEARALVDRLGETMRPAATVAITDDVTSPLAQVADCEIPLRSVQSSSPWGFLNALVAHDYVASMILNEDNDDVAYLARTVASTTLPTKLEKVAAEVRSRQGSRLAYVGFGDHGAAALYAALLTNELTTLRAAGHIAEQPSQALLRKANAQLTVLLFDCPRRPNEALRSLATALTASGSDVVLVGDADLSRSSHAHTPGGHLGAEVARNAVLIEHFVSALAA